MPTAPPSSPRPCVRPAQRPTAGLAPWRAGRAALLPGLFSGLFPGLFSGLLLGLLLGLPAGGCNLAERHAVQQTVGGALPTARYGGRDGTGAGNFAGATPPDGPGGTWYLDDGGADRTLSVRCREDGGCVGRLTDAASGSAWIVDRITQVDLGPAGSQIAFCATPRGGATDSDPARWYRASIVEGVLVGRSAAEAQPGVAPGPGDDAYQLHVTGWKAEYFDFRLAPRVFDLLLDESIHARLRIDRDPAREGGFLARMKVYASEGIGAYAENDEYDGVVTVWDGQRLEWQIDASAFVRAFAGVVAGRVVGGSYTVGPGLVGGHSFSGARAEVLGHGFSPLTAAERATWQERTRRQLAHLTMAGAPAPLSTTVSVLQDPLDPFPARSGLFDRDDDPAEYPQAYQLRELAFSYTLADPHGGPPLVRATHGFLAVPYGPPPDGGFPVVLALNGHSGSAAQVMMPDNEDFWYGDAFARRGYVVMAIDISHRPLGDRAGLYTGTLWGDDPGTGNLPHPAIRSPGLDSDWEEDGERTWDALRALDFVLARPDVDGSRVVVTGLSMGGEITNLVGALDPRPTLVVTGGFSPDLSVLTWRGSHGCWRWQHADLLEYIDTSDLLALVAPRPLIVETGKVDYIFSVRPGAPFASDKQVVRRARSAWSDAPDNLLHYLHYDVHHYHVGGFDPWKDVEASVRTPLLDGPDASGTTAWQIDPTTIDTGRDLFETIDAYFAR